MSAMFPTVNRLSLAGRLIGARVRLASVTPLVVLLILFKLSISDGGRHPPTLSLAQTVVDLLVIVLAAAGALQVPRPGVAALAVAAVAAVSTAWSVQLEVSVQAVLRWLMYAGLLVGTASTLRSSAAARRLVDGAVVVLLTRGPGRQLFEGGLPGRATSTYDAGGYSFVGRLNFWRAGLAIFVDHPVVGTGPGTFGIVHAAYQRDVRYYARDAHSLYVQTAAEQGVVGLAALAGLLGVLVTTWIGALRASQQTPAYPLVAGIGLGLGAFFVHSGLDMDWMFPANPGMAMVLAGVLAWFAKGGRPGRQALVPWQRGAVIGVMLLAMGATQVIHLADRMFVSAQGLARAGRWREAAERYAQAARWDPFNSRIPAAQATALMQLTPPRRDAAEAALRRAMAVDHVNAAHPARLALLLMDRTGGEPGNLAEAEGLLLQALRLDPWNRPEAYRTLAKIYLQQGRVADAERLYQQVVPQYLGKGLGRPTVLYAFLWPEITNLVLDAADLAIHRTQRIDAVMWMQAVLAEDPGATAIALRLSGLYLEMGRLADARAILESTAARVPDDPDIVKA